MLVEPGVRLIGVRTGYTRSEILGLPLSKLLAEIEAFTPDPEP